MNAGLHVAFRTLLHQLCDAAQPNTQDLFRCDRHSAERLVRTATILIDGRPNQGMEVLRTSLTHLLEHAHKEMASTEGRRARGWRRIYTDACTLLAYADILDFSASPDKDEDNAFPFSALSYLDHSIVIAGAPGDGRLDAILDLIDGIQAECLGSPPNHRRDAPFVAAVPPSPNPNPTSNSNSNSNSVAAPLLSAEKSVLRLDTPPSLGAFITRLSSRPFVLPGFLLDWPALNAHPWASLEYLRAAAGPGRVVPVEVGSDYRKDDWTQKMMAWDAFLASIEELEKQREAGLSPGSLLYLAQHSLFNQFPALKEDVIVPDYVYSDLPPPDDYPQYVPPANDDHLVLNAWLGPAGTVSPAHTDPFFNFYGMFRAETYLACVIPNLDILPGQVVGRKTIWLAPPKVSRHMYPYPSRGKTASGQVESSDQPRNPAANTENPSMSNTSRVDVLVSSPEDVANTRAEFPEFWESVVPEAMAVTLEPGDLLFFPPGWWHSLRSEETSFSVSMWF